MTDWLSVMERGLKAVRYGIFQASDNISFLLDGLCCAPEESKDNCGSCGRPKDAAHRPDCRNPDAREFAFDAVHLPSSAASPQVAVVAPSPKQGSDSPPRDSTNPPAPSGGTQLDLLDLPWEVVDLRQDWSTTHRFERPWGITDSCGCVIARIGTQAAAEAVVAALNPK